MVQIALSIRQPWAELILQHKKDIETRSWNTHYRGAFLIHAPKKIDLEACDYFKIDPKSLITGALIGNACVVSSIEYLTSNDYFADNSRHAAGFLGYSQPKFGFVLTNVERIDSRPCRGALGFFKVSENGI
jgi:hypothetical protein